jgi:hypothetical protein
MSLVCRTRVITQIVTLGSSVQPSPQNMRGHLHKGERQKTSTQEPKAHRKGHDFGSTFLHMSCTTDQVRRPHERRANQQAVCHCEQELDHKRVEIAPKDNVALASDR